MLAILVAVVIVFVSGLFLQIARKSLYEKKVTKSKEQHEQDVNEVVKALKERKVKRITLQRSGVSYIARSKPYKTDHVSASIDVSRLNGVVEFDPEKKTIVVEPSITFFDLCSFTTKRGFMPLVVPELTGITVGGAIQGLAGESTCFRNGLFDDSCLFFDLVLSDGTKVRADEKNYAELFYGVRGSYGSLAILVAIGLKLEEVEPFVLLTHTSFKTKEEALEYMWRQMESVNKKDKKSQTQLPPIDFIDGITFSPSHTVVVEGRKMKQRERKYPFYLPLFFSQWYYRHVEEVGRPGSGYSEVMYIMDYLFRYDRGTFWIASYKIGDTLLKRIFLGAFMASKNLYTIRAKRTDQQTESKGFIQDLMIPYEKAIELMDLNETKLGVYPIWLCPIWNKYPNRQKIFTLCSKSCFAFNDHKARDAEKKNFVMNLGVYGDPLVKPYSTVERNKEVERFICDGGGVKVLHACSYYSPEEFAEIYDMKTYMELREKYLAQDCFPTIYEKVVRKDI